MNDSKAFLLMWLRIEAHLMRRHSVTLQEFIDCHQLFNRLRHTP